MPEVETSYSQTATTEETTRGLKPVAYIMSRFPRLTETFILREILELERQGQPVAIFPLLRVQQPVKHREAELVMSRVCYTPFLSLPIVQANAHYLVRYPRRYLAALFTALEGTLGSANLFFGAVGIFPKSVYLARLIEQRGIQHIHAHFATHPALAALIVSELTGIFFSFTAHAHDIFVHRQMLREKVEKARFVVAVSQFNKKFLQDLFSQSCEGKIRVIHCGLEMEHYATFRPRTKGEPIHGERRFTILCVASLRPYKGIPYLLEACRLLRERVPDFCCLIVGEGPDRKKLEQKLAELNLGANVRLLGPRPQHEVLTLLEEADLFVLPSVVAPNGQMEGIPVALMEAMAIGLPVIATNISGIPELVEHGKTGLLVGPCDGRALADAITVLIDRPELRRQLGSRAQEKVAEEFDIHRNVAELRSLFQTSATSKVVAPPELPAAICDWIDRILADEGTAYRSHRHAKRIRISERIAGQDSQIHEVSLEGSPTAQALFILKLHRPRRTLPGELKDGVERARECARREYEALCWLWAEFSSRSRCFCVPKPMGYDADHAAVLMEKAAGRNFSSLLRWARPWGSDSSRERLCGYAEACGEWLGTFHLITQRNEAPYSHYQRLQREFSEQLATCTALGLSAGLSKRIADWFDENKSRLFTGKHCVVARHGDYGPHNLLLVEDKVTALDFEGLQQGINLEDLAYFLALLETMPKYHVARRQMESLRLHFLRGYCQVADVNDEQLRISMVASMAQVIAHDPSLRETRTWGAWKRRQRLSGFERWFSERVR